MNGRVVLQVPGLGADTWVVIKTHQAGTLGTVEARCATSAQAEIIRNALNAAGV